MRRSRVSIRAPAERSRSHAWSMRACGAGAWALMRAAARARVALRHMGGMPPVVRYRGARGPDGAVPPGL